MGLSTYECLFFQVWFYWYMRNRIWLAACINEMSIVVYLLEAAIEAQL